MNLSNLSSEIQKEFDDITKNQTSISPSVAAWLNNAQNQMPSRVEATKQAINQYNYNGILGTLCSDNGIDKYLILGLIAVESNGDPYANVGSSASDYWGCMQTDKSALVRPMDSSQSGDILAQTGIETGIKMFKSKFSCFPDNIWLSIAAYNAGQGTVGNSIENLGSEAALRWWNTIPYISATADTYWPGQGKAQEVGEYAIKVMYAYTLFSGYEVKLGNLPQAAADLSSSSISGLTRPGLSAPANESIKTELEKHGKHMDSRIQAPDKVYCEPVYPDLVSVSSEVPAYYSVQSDIPTSQMVLGANMNYTIPTGVLTSYYGPESVSYNVYNELVEEQRKVAFNAEEHRQTTKVPSSGKPANNNDPFPTDAKIEELETHQPRVKIKEIKACPEAVTTAKAAVQLSINTEKRLVRLENNMATILRYLSRLSSRVPINCVYYGGQITTEKYRCIRCLKDDRISDGQCMTIDQCLNCTRYEPLIGQVYDILNDQGINLSQILDDCQMSYTTMSEYCDFVTATSYQTDLETTTLDANGVQNRLINETDFQQDWPAGLKMDWNLYPVEDQRPHINARQSVDENGYSPLSSNYGTAVNYGYAYTNVGAGSASDNKILQNRDLMEAIYNSTNSDEDSDSSSSETEKHIAYEAISEAKEFAEAHSDQFVEEMTAYIGKNIADYFSSNGIDDMDNILVAAITFANDQDFTDVINNLQNIKRNLSSQNIDNSVLLATFYSLNTKYLYGANQNIEDKTFPRRLDKVTKIITVTNEGGESGSETTEIEVGFDLDWNNINNWNWTEFIEPLNINYTSNQRADTLNDDLYTFAKIAYVYGELYSKCHTSSYDNDSYGFSFPIFEADLPSCAYTSPYGQRYINGSSSFHYGVDIGGIIGIGIHSIAEGTVHSSSGFQDPGGGNIVVVQHPNGYFSRYMHLNDVTVKAGDTISKGQLIGHMGTTGSSTGPHLHFEVCVNGYSSQEAKDPTIYFPRLGSIAIGNGLAN